MMLLIATVLAATIFPIPELGQCRDTQECALYCEVPAHKAACWAYQTYQVDVPAVLGETTTSNEEVKPTAPTLIFPISELGNCNNIRECKAFCDIPTNATVCRAFGQKKGLSRASSNYGQQTALLAHAKEELGCTSLQQCRAHCNDPVNADQCQALATKFAPTNFKVARETLLERARTTLNCTTLAECRAYCENPVNKETCAAFAKEQTPEHFRQKMLIRPNDRSEIPVPLPCTTLAECQVYCQNPQHATACAMVKEKNSVKINIQQEKSFTCNTKEECERYCQANPDQCPSYSRSKDYERVKLQQQLRTQVHRPASPTELEKYRASLITPTPAP